MEIKIWINIAALSRLYIIKVTALNFSPSAVVEKSFQILFLSKRDNIIMLKDSG